MSSEPDPRRRPDTDVEPPSPADGSALEFTGCPECGQPAEVITDGAMLTVWCIMRHRFTGTRESLLGG